MNIREAITIVEQQSPILVWHGGRINGSPVVQAPAKGRYEAGPGIYFTTRLSTAAKYAKGGGSVYLTEISRGMRFADEVSIPLDKVVAFVRNSPRMKRKKEIIADLEANARRMKSDVVRANVLINLVVNWEAGAGEVGKRVAAFLVDCGVDASIETPSGQTRTGEGEQWLVVFNPAIILKATKMRATDITDEMRNLPPVR